MSEFQRKILTKSDLEKIESEIEWNEVLGNLHRAQMAETNNPDHIEYLRLCSAMALHRVMILRVKLLNVCQCPRNHAELIKDYYRHIEDLETFLFDSYTVNPSQL